MLQLDLTRMNFGSLTTSGVDVGASYAFDAAAGHFAADVKATWIDEYEAFDLPGERRRIASTSPTSSARLQSGAAIASLDWQRGALGATTYVRYIPSYDDTLNGVRNGRTIPSQTFLDLQFSGIGSLTARHCAARTRRRRAQRPRSASRTLRK